MNPVRRRHSILGIGPLARGAFLAMISVILAGCSTIDPQPPPSPPLPRGEGPPEIPADLLGEDPRPMPRPSPAPSERRSSEHRSSERWEPGLAGELPAPEADAAILLPLSGKDAALGWALFDAAQMALFDAGREDFVLLPLDTGSDEDGARRAARQAILGGVEIVLGPVYADHVRAAAPVILDAGRPVRAFSSDRSVAGGGVSIVGHLREEEILSAVSHAVDDGARRFALIASQGKFANRIQRRLDDALSRRSAILSESVIYDPSLPLRPWIADFAQRAMIEDPAAPIVAADDPPNPDNPADPPEKIFIHDALILAVDRLIDVAAMLSYYDIDTASTRVIIDGRWNSQRLWDEPALEGAVFAAALTPGKDRFESRYRQFYGHAPPDIAGVVYDAVRQTIDRSQAVDDRPSGLIRLDEAGLPVRDLRLFRVGRSSILPLAPRRSSR